MGPAYDGAVQDATTTRRVPAWTWGFAPYAAISLLHVVLLAASSPAAAPTKLLLMPALALAVLWAGRGTGWGRPAMLLFIAIALSWLGDGATTFIPLLPDVPVMLASFGLAHLAYIWLFTQDVSNRALPRWTGVYALWWITLLIVLFPRLGVLTIAVAAYGLVLACTAATSARVSILTAVGGAFFLASDTVLAFRLFAPETMPDGTSPLVMATYTCGQGLIAAGVVRVLRHREGLR